MPQLKKQRILYIDTSEPLTKELVGQFTHRGYIVQWQPDLEVGLRGLVNFSPDLVVVEPYAPEYRSKMTFEKIMKSVRAELPRVPVLVLTGWANIRNAVDCKRHGAADFVSKPWDFVDLEVAVERVLDEASPRRGRAR